MEIPGESNWPFGSYEPSRSAEQVTRIRPVLAHSGDGQACVRRPLSIAKQTSYPNPIMGW